MTNPLRWPWLWMRLLLYSTSTQAVSEAKTWHRHRRNSSSSWSKPESSTFHILWSNVGHFPRDLGGGRGVTESNKNNDLEFLFRLISLPEYNLLGKEKKTSNLCKRVLQQVFISCAEKGRKQLQPLPLLEWRSVYCLYCTVKKMKVSSFALSRGRCCRCEGEVQHEATHPECTLSTTLYLI